MPSAVTTDIPCRGCGLRTDQRVTWTPGRSRPGVRAREFEQGICDECVSLDLDAPGSAVRAALRLLGKPEGDWALAAEAFAEFDVSLLLYRAARPQAKAWDHVSKDQRRDLRRAYVRVLDARVHASTHKDFPPEPTPPPEGYGDGCAYCGVAVALDWEVIASSAFSHGTRVRERVLCPACLAATVEHGESAIGTRAWTGAFCEARGLTYKPDVPILGVRPYALTPDARPGKVPWAFLPDGLAYPEPPLPLDLQVALLADRVAALEARLGE